MKFLFTATFFLFTFTVASAQIKINIYWTTTNTLKPAETIYYDLNKPLVWSDFTGAPRPMGNEAALTASGFGFKTSMKTTQDKSSGEINIGVYCYFMKSNSWVKEGRTTDYILAHEQLHFDIAYIATLYFLQKIKSSEITPGNINTLLPTIYKETCDFMNRMQNEYDDQTRHGLDQNMQAKWSANLKMRLTSPQ